MMRYGGYGYGMMGFGLGWIMMIIICIIVILGVIVLIRIISQASRSSNYANKDSQDSALKILNERYAKGEISDEEYKTKKEHLKS